MSIAQGIIAACWFAFVAYWTISGFRAKADLGPRPGAGSAAPLGLAVLALIVAHVPPLDDVLAQAQAYAATNAAMGIAGVVLCVLGVGLAIAARAALGRNWGMPMAQKANPKLVTRGPYAFARHPIYGGMLLAMLGSAIGASATWAPAVVLFGAYFLYSARREESFMRAQFPEQYPAYMRRTWMLVPFLL